MLPTSELYQSLQTAYSHFNHLLFDSTLPAIIFTVQRKKGTLGYFAPDRWTSPEGKHCHEIAINPSHMGQSRIIDVLQTLVHEMVHCWQYCYGNPGRNYYHNKEWAYKMIEIGLQPSSTGKPGGDITGQHMSDFPIEGGRFLQTAIELLDVKSFRIPWIDRVSFPLDLEQLYQPEDQSPLSSMSLESNFKGQEQDPKSTSIETSQETLELLNHTYQQLMPEETFVFPERKSKTKSKHQCPQCKSIAWGKADLNIICGDCDKAFVFCN